MPSAGTITTASNVGISGAATTQVIRSMAMPARVDNFYTTLAAETGGSVLSASAATDLASTFRNVLDTFRSTYVMYFNARGVEPGGYHTLNVSVKRDGAVVQARRGYWY